jgi:4-amino-4-deoxy-L-arabinose transferase-like glycosyltransferase
VRTVDAPPEPTPDARSAATPGPSRAWRDAVTPRRALVAVCLVFVGLSLVVALATPWGEAHDEADHVLNAATIASGSMYRMAPGVQLEAFQPPLYYIGLAAELDLIGANVHRGDFVLSGRPPTVFRHDLATDGSSQRLFDMLRLPSILLGLATILLTAATARRVSKDRWTPVVAAAVVALIPKFVFLSGVVNNDNLSITLGAAATLLAVVLVSDGLSPRRQLAAATGLGVLAGMMAITKFSTLPLLAAWVVTLVLAPLRSRLASFGLFIVGFLVTSGWWFVWNTDVYGDPLASKATQEHLKRFNFLPLTGAMTAHRAFVEVPKAIWFQFFYSSGSNQFRWSNWWYVPFWIVLAVGLVGLALRLPRVGRRALAVLAVISVFSLATVWIAVIDTTSIQARHAFAGLTAIGVLAALGFERLRLPLLARFVLPAMGFVGILVALHQDVFGVFWS